MMTILRSTSLFFVILLVSCPLLQAQDEQGLFSTTEPYKAGQLKVSDLHTIYYECSGNPQGKPVMCLHGGPGVGSYPRLRQYFNPEKYHIVLHDQRGTQRSQPFGELKENTTWDLVEDVEKLRKHLNLDKVLIFGGSWGTTLGLAYAETYPQNVSAMILRGIFLGTKEEIEFHYIGTRYFYPKEHHALLELLPDKSRNTHPNYLFELIRGKDQELSKKVLHALGSFELKFMKLNMPDERVAGYMDSFPEREHFLTVCMDLHYVTNRYFMLDGQLLRHAKKIRHIPAVLINGRYDMASPLQGAFKLHQALPQSKLVIVEEAGHSESEVGITAELIKAAAEFE